MLLIATRSATLKHGVQPFHQVGPQRQQPMARFPRKTLVALVLGPKDCMTHGFMCVYAIEWHSIHTGEKWN